MSAPQPSLFEPAAIGGLRSVTKEEFWAFVMSTSRNVHPYPETCRTVWRDLKTLEVVGIVTNRNTSTGHEPETYRLIAEAQR